jgi:hypothetical protein
MEAPERPRTRRAILVAGAASAAAALASAAAPRAVAAHDPDDVRLGGSNSATVVTAIANGANSNTVLSITSDLAYQAVNVSNASTGTAIVCTSNGGIGVVGNGATGVLGQNTSGAGYGVDGKSFDSNGVGARGWATAATGPSVGVVGRSDSPDGFGVLARNTATGGTALEADGKVRFKRSGRETIAAGKSSMKVTLAGVTSSSLIFAVLASNRSNRWVRAVVPTTGSFTIYLNASVASSTYVKWFVLDPFV